MPEVFTILSDLDGVQAPTHEPVMIETARRLATRNYNCPIQYSDLTSWHTIYRTSLAMTQDREFTQWVNQSWFDPNILIQSRPYTGALLALRTMNNIKGGIVEVHTVTSRIPALKESTLVWQQKHAPWHMPNRLHLRSEQEVDGGLTGDQFKANAARNLRANVFFEDNPDTWKCLVEAGIPTVLIAQPWNFTQEELDPYRCVNSFASFIIPSLVLLRNWCHSKKA
jgi:hypothetical protein